MIFGLLFQLSPTACNIAINMYLAKFRYQITRDIKYLSIRYRSNTIDQRNVFGRLYEIYCLYNNLWIYQKQMTLGYNAVRQIPNIDILNCIQQLNVRVRVRWFRAYSSIGHYNYTLSACLFLGTSKNAFFLMIISYISRLMFISTILEATR